MKVSVTATQSGLTFRQLEWAMTRTNRVMKELLLTEFHHGGCIGGDDQLQHIVGVLRRTLEEDREDFTGPVIELHRGSTPEKWADDGFADEIHGPEDNIARNHIMVDLLDPCGEDEMWAFPGEQAEVLRSGTWATIRYAKKQGVNLYVIYPDGTIERFACQTKQVK